VPKPAEPANLDRLAAIVAAGAAGALAFAQDQPQAARRVRSQMRAAAAYLVEFADLPDIDVPDPPAKPEQPPKRRGQPPSGNIRDAKLADLLPAPATPPAPKPPPRLRGRPRRLADPGAASVPSRLTAGECWRVAADGESPGV
jgi:hypothetical protein